MYSGRAGRSGRAEWPGRVGPDRFGAERSGFFQEGFGVKGRPAPGRLSPVEPAAKCAGGRAGRSSFFQAGRVAGRAGGRSKLRPAAGRKPSALGRAGRKSLLAAPVAKDFASPAGRLVLLVRSVRLVRSRSRPGPNFLGRKAGRSAAGAISSSCLTARGRLLGLGRTVGKRPASSRLRRRSSLDFGVRSLPSAAWRSAATSCGCSSRRFPGSWSRTRGP